MTAPRVLIAVEPPMHAEALAFSLRKRRPRAEVFLLDDPGDLEAEVRRVRPHLVVANRVPRAARGAAFWVRVAEPLGGGGAKALGADVSTDGHSRRVADVGAADVIEALDRAEGQLLLGLGHAQEGSRGGGGS